MGGFLSADKDPFIFKGKSYTFTTLNDLSTGVEIEKVNPVALETDLILDAMNFASKWQREVQPRLANKAISISDIDSITLY